MNTPSVKLVLDKYIDIDITDNYDSQNDAIFSANVSFKIDADENGLSFDVYEVIDMNLSYTGVIYTEEPEDPETEINTNLENFTKEVYIEKTDKEYQILSLDSVDINFNTSVIKITFTY
jgi:hypothetical protein